jgi:hypothetical protein
MQRMTRFEEDGSRNKVSVAGLIAHRVDRYGGAGELEKLRASTKALEEILTDLLENLMDQHILTEELVLRITSTEHSFSTIPTEE